MPSVCIYFQVHQPYRVSQFSYFDSGSWRRYFDDTKNGSIIQRVAAQSYIPTNRKILELIQRHEGRFRLAYSISGVCLEQMEYYAPEALQTFVDLSRTGCVEFLGETYYHSLASLFSPTEFEAQVRYHSRRMRELFGQDPMVMRNTELLYDDGIGRMAANMGFKGILAEGVDDVLRMRSPNYVYSVPGTGTALLLKNYKLSDDIAFRYSDTKWHGYPLTPEKFTRWMRNTPGGMDVINLFMDYETFGEHHWVGTGIFDFLDGVPAAVLRDPAWSFSTPSEIIDRYPKVAPLSFNRLTSWADIDRDASAWTGNRLQQKAFWEMCQLDGVVRDAGDPALLETWRKLQGSDHFYYMSTKSSTDGQVHSYFNAFESPYDAFLYYMNVMKDFRSAVTGRVNELYSGGERQPLEVHRAAVEASVKYSKDRPTKTPVFKSSQGPGIKAADHAR